MSRLRMAAARTAPLAISGSPPLTATQGVAYAGFTPTVTGGSGGNSFSMVGTASPAGFSMDTSTGAVTGTPTGSGTVSGIIQRVTDSFGHTADLSWGDLVVGGAGAFASLAPSAGWNGTAGSGFGGSYSSIPLDPTRLTAKPWLRHLFAPNQALTSNLTIGVDAGAAGAKGSGYWGVSKVRFHLEGNYVDVAAEALFADTDVNGAARWQYGHHCILNIAAALSQVPAGGIMHLYVETFPNDPTMQRRVIGPFKFYPVATATDCALTVANSATDVAGATYNSLQKALNYLAANGKTRGVITITESGDYPLVGPATGRQGEFPWTIIQPAAGITVNLRRDPALTNFWSGQANWACRLAFDYLCFRGAGIKFQTDKIGQWYPEAGGPGATWWDGVEIFSTLGAGGLMNGEPLGDWVRNDSTRATLAYYATDCYIHDQELGFEVFQLARGGTGARLSGDITQRTLCVHNFVHTDYSSDPLRLPVPGMTIRYTGAGSCTIAKTYGGVTIVANGTTYNLSIVKKDPSYGDPNGVNWTVAQLVASLNAISGIAAADLGSGRASHILQKSSTVIEYGNITTTTVTSSDMTLYSGFDDHGDVDQSFELGPAYDSDTEMRLKARALGTAGNGMAISKTGSVVTLSGSTFSGGTGTTDADAVSASVVVSLASTVPADGDTLVVNGTTYTFKATPTTANHIRIGSSRADTVLAMLKVFRASTDFVVDGAKSAGQIMENTSRRFFICLKSVGAIQSWFIEQEVRDRGYRQCLTQMRYGLYEINGGLGCYEDHVAFEACVIDQQNLQIGTASNPSTDYNQDGYLASTYTAFRRCSIDKWTYSYGADSAMTLDGCHFRFNASVPTPGANSKASNNLARTSIFADPDNGNFTPISSQLTMPDGSYAGIRKPDGAWNF